METQAYDSESAVAIWSGADHVGQQASWERVVYMHACFLSGPDVSHIQLNEESAQKLERAIPALAGAYGGAERKQW